MRVKPVGSERGFIWVFPDKISDKNNIRINFTDFLTSDVQVYLEIGQP